MERKDAIAKLSKLLGKSAGYMINPKAPTKEERDEATASVTEACAKRKRLADQMEERKRVILAADTEYQRLISEYKTAREHADQILSLTRRYKITVGTTVGGMFFRVMAEGDSWEEIFAALKNRVIA